MNIYRVLQEAINNAIKDARPNKIAIEVRMSEDKVAIKVADDGIGFDINEVVKGNGLLTWKNEWTVLAAYSR